MSEQNIAPGGQEVSPYTATAVMDMTMSSTNDTSTDMSQPVYVPAVPTTVQDETTIAYQPNTASQPTYDNPPYVPQTMSAEQGTTYQVPTERQPAQPATMPVMRGPGQVTDDGPPISQRKERVIQEIKRRKFDKKAKSKLFVGGLYAGADESFLYEKFKPYGELLDACIVYEKGTTNSRGFGYVTFANSEDAANAMKEVDGLRTNGRTLCVEYADDPKRNSRGPPPPPHRRHRSRSPPFYPPRSYPPPPPRDYYYDDDRYRERDRYPSRERYREPDPYYYERDRYERDRYYMRSRDPYDSYYHRDYPPRESYPPRDYPPRDYRRDYPPSPRDEYDNRRSPPPRYGYRDRYGRDLEPPGRPYNYRISDVDSARLRVNREEVRRVDDGRETSGAQSQSDSNSSEDGKQEKRKKTKPRQVSAFPSAYLS